MAKPVLSTQERNDLVKFLVNLGAFAGEARDRRDFVRSADLAKFVPGINWSGPDSVVAGNLVDVLNTHGFLVENPSYHALGRLLAFCLDYPNVGVEDATFLATLIVRHGLVRDPEYLEKLRQTYGIAETPPPEAVPAPQPSVLAPVAPPTFTVSPAIKDAPGLEKALSDLGNYLDIYMLVGALYSAQAVGRVETADGRPLGTGWLIGPDVLMTNCHVLPSPEYAAEGVVRFGLMKDLAGVKLAGECVAKIDPDFYYTSPIEQLDYALVRLEEKPLAAKTPPGGVAGQSMLDLVRHDQHRGYLVAVGRPILNLQPVNIIQHPNGQPLKAVLTQNLVAGTPTATRVHYRADTDSGSSGSPVFNGIWEVIALHHSAGPYPPPEATAAGAQEPPVTYNEGIPMKAILEDLKARKDKKGISLLAYVPEPK